MDETDESESDLIQKLRQALINLNSQLVREKKSKLELEDRLRNEICAEMKEHITEIESNYE